MAKKQAKPAPMPGARTPTIVALKGSAEWKVWLEELAALNGAPVTVTIEQALRELANRLGHSKPPARY